MLSELAVCPMRGVFWFWCQGELNPHMLAVCMHQQSEVCAAVSGDLCQHGDEFTLCDGLSRAGRFCASNSKLYRTHCTSQGLASDLKPPPPAFRSRETSSLYCVWWTAAVTVCSDLRVWYSRAHIHVGLKKFKHHRRSLIGCSFSQRESKPVTKTD